jgi:zinc protease
MIHQAKGPLRGRYTFGVLRVLVVLVLLLGPAAPTLAADAVTATTLDNGLRVLLVEDHRSPVVSFQVWYRVGSRNETRGRTGLAHFLEHMMFKGTAAHGPRQYSGLIEQNGGQDNAFTSQDVTAYYVNIAADRLGLVVRPRGRPPAQSPARPQGDRRRTAGRARGASDADRG